MNPEKKIPGPAQVEVWPVPAPLRMQLKKEEEKKTILGYIWILDKRGEQHEKLGKIVNMGNLYIEKVYIEAMVGCCKREGRISLELLQ